MGIADDLITLAEQFKETNGYDITTVMWSEDPDTLMSFDEAIGVCRLIEWMAAA